MVARILFHPLEETSRALFSKHLTNTEKFEDRSILVQESRDLVSMLFQFNIVLGAFFVFFGTNYTHTLLEILYSKGRSEGPRILSVYCLYVPFMGINGVSEAFLQAVGNASVLLSQTVYLSICWVFLFIASYILLTVLELGSVGLVIANILNLLLRIIFSTYFIYTFFNNNPGKDLKKFKLESFFVGNFSVWISFIVSWCITRKFDFGIDSVRIMVSHVVVGGICCGICVFMLYRSERYKLIPRIHKYVKLMKS